MRNKSSAIFGVVLSLAGLWAPAASAVDQSEKDQLTERRRLLEAREAEISRDVRDIQVLQNYVGILQDYRDNKLFGPQGSSAAINTWNRDFSAWLATWDQLLGMLSTLSDANVLQKMPAIRDLIRSQSEALGELMGRAVVIGGTAQQQKILVPALPESVLRDQSDTIRMLNDKRVVLQQIADKIAGDFNTQSLAYIGDSMHAVRDAALAKMRIIALNFPALKDRLAEAQSALTFVDQFAPRVHGVMLEGNAVYLATSSFRPFAARAAWERLNKMATAARSDMTAAAGVPAVVRNSMLQDLASAVQTAQALIDTSANPADDAFNVASYARDQRVRMTSDCRVPQLVPQRNCELLRTLNAIKISPDALSTWSKGDLAYLEAQLDKVEKPASWQPQGGK